jgi:hypothetical protein
MRALIAPLVLLLGLVAAWPANAADPAPLPNWEQLSDAQRQALIAPLRERWNSQPQARQNMLEHARRWQAMSPQQREQARRGQQRFERMSPQQREQSRQLFQAMRALPESERQALRQRWGQMSEQQRRQWLQQHAGSAPAR